MARCSSTSATARSSSTAALIEEIEEAPGLSTDDDDPYGTAAGFVHWHLDRMPQEGDRFDAHGIRAEVLDVEGNRLRRLRCLESPSAICPWSLKARVRR